MKGVMKKLYLLGSLFLLSGTGYAQYTFLADSTKLVIDGDLNPFSELQPGDTIKLLPGIRPFIIFKNIHGNPDLPIVICNAAGTVEINSDHYFGISIRKSSHVKFSGKGTTALHYGIKIYNRVGSGLSIGDYSTSIEVENVEVGYSQFSGIVAKTEPACGFLRTDFIQENTVIHDCYVHHTGTEGMYIGSSFYNGQVIQCDSAAITVLPPLLKNVDIYNNIVEYTGWDGIQVSSAVNTSIHHNQIKFDSQYKADWQMNGIILGEGSTGEIFNNSISDGEGSGIFTNGLGDIYIYNNKIIRPGKSNDKPSGSYGMYVDEKSSISGMHFFIFNNLILNAKSDGIRFISSNGKKKNFIINNIIIKEVITNSNFGDKLINVVGAPVSEGSNIVTSDIDLLRFEDAANDDFRIQEGSLIIDAGQSTPFKNFSEDYNGEPRNIGNSIDIGPYESPFERIDNANCENRDIAYPNPVNSNDRTTINFSNPVEGWIEFVLVDANGKQLKALSRNYFLQGNQFKTINVSELNPGINFIQIKKRQENTMIRICVNDP